MIYNRDKNNPGFTQRRTHKVRIMTHVFFFHESRKTFENYMAWRKGYAWLFSNASFFLVGNCNQVNQTAIILWLSRSSQGHKKEKKCLFLSHFIEAKCSKKGCLLWYIEHFQKVQLSLSLNDDGDTISALFSWFIAGYTVSKFIKLVYERGTNFAIFSFQTSRYNLMLFARTCRVLYWGYWGNIYSAFCFIWTGINVQLLFWIGRI